MIWYFTEEGAVPRDLEGEGVVFREGAPSLEDYPTATGSDFTLVILDDLLTQLDKSIVDFFLKGAHHRNLFVFMLVQNIFSKNLREISLNCHVVVIFKNRRDLRQIKNFCQQCMPGNANSLYAAYLDATSGPGHTYLLFDFHPCTEERLRFRTAILPHETQTFYVLKKSYK